MAESWGAALYGDPCDECSFDWSAQLSEALRLVARAPKAFAEVTARASGDERAAGWSVSEYVSHVADNLRQWAERVQVGLLSTSRAVVGYDPDDLARVRRYEVIPLAVALWSLGVSAESWVAVMDEALATGVTLTHESRGLQTTADIVRNNAHDLHHHLWDVAEILARR